MLENLANGTQAQDEIDVIFHHLNRKEREASVPVFDVADERTTRC